LVSIFRRILKLYLADQLMRSQNLLTILRILHSLLFIEEFPAYRNLYRRRWLKMEPKRTRNHGIYSINL